MSAAERERLAYTHRNDPAMLQQIFAEFRTRTGVEVSKFEGDMQVNNEWLELQIDGKRDEIRAAVRKAAEAEEERARQITKTTNESLRRALGEEFRKNVPTAIA